MSTCSKGHPKTGPGHCKVCAMTRSRRAQERARDRDRIRLGPNYPDIVPELARKVWRA